MANPSQDNVHETSNGVVTANGHNYGSFPSIANGSTEPVSPTSQENALPKPKQRALAPDLLRGLLCLIMALDHTSLVLHTFRHGTGQESESDGTIIKAWNPPVAYIVRTLTHLCGSGFTFLLGMGVVYLGRSRSKLGWGSVRLAKYFALRAAVLTLITVVLGVAATAGKIWFLNMVLFSLAIDYLLTGILWIGISKTEPLLAGALAKAIPDDISDEAVDEPLLPSGMIGDQKTSRATTLSWHIHNGILVVLSVVTIWWNTWLSENHGHCRTDLSTSSTESGFPETAGNTWLRIWFWPVMNGRVMSGFPPMAWLSFSILGLLYGRIVVAKVRTRNALIVGQLSVAAVFILVFVMTRVLRVGNLSEHCLQTPAHQAHPGTNPYLISPQSFFYLIKYPPDVAFWSFTIAGVFTLLAAFDAIPIYIAKRISILLDFGTSALFFYVIHLVVVFTVGALIVALFGHETGIEDPMNAGKTKGIDSIPGYFAIWAGLMLICWPMCRLYSRFKSSKSADSVWRFF